MNLAGISTVGVVLMLCAPVCWADDSLRDLCPDRPGKNTSACTADAGTFQIESDIVNATFQHLDGLTTDTWLVTNPTLKYGLSDDVDIEVGVSPLEIVRTHVSVTDETMTAAGISDLFLRAKWAVTGNGGSDFALVLEPFLKVPTARRALGNGAVEGGLMAPISLSLGDHWSLGTTPELDILKNTLDGGRHPALTEVVAISRDLGSGLSLGGEFWEASDFEPGHTTQQYSFDLDGAWIPDDRKDMQIDAGLNLGLNRSTPGVQFYTGISHRF